MMLVSFISINILLWALLDGECWMTLIDNKMKNHEYKIGSDIFNIHDLGISPKYYDEVIFYIRLSSIIIFIGVFIRNYKRLNLILWSSVYITLIVYLYLLAHKNKISDVFKYILIILTLLNYSVFVSTYGVN